MIKRYTKIVLFLFMFLFLVTEPVHAGEYYSANVGYQVETSKGWSDFAYGGALGGSEGLESIKTVQLHLVDAPYLASIEYRVYTTHGWLDWSNDFEASGDGSAILGLQVRLANYPNATVHYQTYRDNLGWGTWVKDGKTSGTLKAEQAITGIRVKVFEIGVEYSGSISGAKLSTRHNGETLGEGKFESLQLNLMSAPDGAKITYRVYIHNEGWTSWVSNNAVLGSSGKVIEAIEAKLEGLNEYHLAIQPYIENTGWVDWAYDGSTAGYPSGNLAILDYRVKIEKKVYVAPVATVVSTPVASTPSIGSNQNTSTLTYSAGANANASFYASARTTAGYPALTVDSVFDDNPAGVSIGVGDQFTASLFSFTIGDHISAPDTFSGYGDNKVDNNQFEVFYGTYDATTHIFTVNNLPGGSTTGSTHTLILYDNDSVSNMVLDGFILTGVFTESNWRVSGVSGSRYLEYIDLANA